MKKAVSALGFKKLSVITLLCSFEKSCLSKKLFVTHSSLGNCVKVRTFLFLDQRNNSVGGFGVHSDATREVEVNNLPPVAHSEADMLQAYATAAGKVEDLTIPVLA